MRTEDAANATDPRSYILSSRTRCHLRVHNVCQVQGLIDDRHEGLSKDGGDKDVCHGQQAVRTEGLDHEQAMDGLTDRRCKETRKMVTRRYS